MPTYGVHEVYNKTALVKRAVMESARLAVVKACFDTEAHAKEEITRQVYDTPEIPGSPRTGAARASIYVSISGMESGYAKMLAEVKAANPDAELFPDVTLYGQADTIEGVVAVGVLYGYWIETGVTRVHVSVPPRPFMLPAAETVGAVFERYCREQLDAQLRAL
jgi:hypothetical protein